MPMVTKNLLWVKVQIILKSCLYKEKCEVGEHDVVQKIVVLRMIKTERNRKGLAM